MRATPARAEPGRTLHFSTSDFAEPHRFTATQELLGRQFLKMDIEPLPARRFYQEWKLHLLRDLSVARGRGSGSRLVRSKAMIENGDFVFSIGVGGPRQLCQLGREVALGSGDAVLVANGDPCEATVSAYQGILLRLPAVVAAQLVPDIHASVARRIPAASPALQLLAGYVRLLRSASDLADPELQRVFTTHVHDLVALALGGTRDAVEVAKTRGLRAARARAIIEEIERCFADAHFSPAAVAAKLAMSPRSVQDLLQETGLSFTDRVMELRLKRARAMLESADNDHRKIVDIAYRCGFNDLSHFNRCFRRRFGDTPSAARSMIMTKR